MSTTAPPNPALAPSRLLPRDILRVGALGLASRRMRAGLSILGIAIGIAALVAVLGISESSRSDLLAQLDSLGTNLLTAAPGQSLLGGASALPDDAATMVARIGPVEAVSSVATVDATVRRSELIDENETGGIGVSAADTGLLETLGGTMRTGTFLTSAVEGLPTVVLGSVAAERLGVDRTGVQVLVDDVRYTVVGIMDELPLAQDLDRAALIGFEQATSGVGAGERPDTSKLYVRADPSEVAAVRDVMAATANPENPEEVDVSRPSDVLEARAATDQALTALFLGLGAVALLVGGIGIANVMVISVLERRSEIGLRRALGATERHVGVQFLTESLILATLGGIGGLIIGSAVTAAYALSQGWSVTVPLIALAGGLLAALVIGAVAGLYPALRASRLSPTDALRAA
jgi:putative ABC transport system permease protein